MNRAPLWGSFVHHADEDLLAFGLLASAHLLGPAFYHGTQATEKYLKALCLSLLDPQSETETSRTQKWTKTHNLVALAGRCAPSYPYYAQVDVLDTLRRIAEFDQVARYPWGPQAHGNGFTSRDIPVVGDLCCHLRWDLPISRDNYKLAMEVRGYFLDSQKTPDPSRSFWSHQAVEALRQVLPNLDDFVRWEPSTTVGNQAGDT